MTKKIERDPELEKLLQAFREVNPSPIEKAQWRAAIADELREALPVSAAPSGRGKIFKLFVRVGLPVAVAASLGFVFGAAFIENRMNQGEAMLFSQIDSESRETLPPNTMDETRQVVRTNLNLSR